MPQKRCKRVKPLFPILDPQHCSKVWSADYKGKFLMGNKSYCHHLTIADSKSRFIFFAKGHYKETLKQNLRRFLEHMAYQNKYTQITAVHLVM